MSTSYNYAQTLSNFTRGKPGSEKSDPFPVDMEGECCAGDGAASCVDEDREPEQLEEDEEAGMPEGGDSRAPRLHLCNKHVMISWRALSPVPGGRKLGDGQAIAAALGVLP